MDMSKIAIFRVLEVSGDLSGDPPDDVSGMCISCDIPWICPRGILGHPGAHMVSRGPLGVHRWLDTLSEGVRIGVRCGKTGVSSYSRVVFWHAKMVQIHGFHGSGDRSKMTIFRGFGGI